MADPLSSPAAVVLLGKREQKAVLPFSMSEWGDPDESKYSVKLQNMMGSMAQYNGTVPRHNVSLTRCCHCRFVRVAHAHRQQDDGRGPSGEAAGLSQVLRSGARGEVFLCRDEPAARIAREGVR